MSDAVFFDLDGTLTDPGLGITRSIQYALERLDCSVPERRELTWCIGPPLQDSFGSLVGHDRAERALALYRERYADVGWLENAPYAGIDETLARLAERSVPLYVATAKPGVFARRILDHFDLSQHFDGVFAAELDGTRSRKEDLLSFALAETGLAHATMIGDREHDVLGARANGMRAIGVSYGYGSQAELERAGADAIVHTPAAIAGQVD